MKWIQNEELKSSFRSTCLYLDGGLKNVTESAVVSQGTLDEVAVLQSTKNEADSRIILHSIYSFQKEGSERLDIDANDTDVIVSCVYYVLHHFKNFLKCGCDHTIQLPLDPSDGK